MTHYNNINDTNAFRFDHYRWCGFFFISIKISEAASESDLPPEELFDVDVDIKEKISSRRNDTIESVFRERWKYDYDNGESFYHRMSVDLIFEIVQDFLYECCLKNQHTPFCDLDTYKKHYSQRLIDYLKFLPSDISEEDFIKEELEHSQLIKEELKKPVYEIKYSKDSCNEFVTLLRIRLDKRISFLERKYQRIVAAADDDSIQVNNQFSSEDDVAARVRKHFGFFHGQCPRKHKQILNDDDFANLIKWTVYYYKNNFSVPEIEKPIRTVNTNKTFVQLAFKYLFKEMYPNSIYPDSLFNYYQAAFLKYSDDSRTNFRSVSNNDEVKKLMLIDY